MSHKTTRSIVVSSAPEISLPSAPQSEVPDAPNARFTTTASASKAIKMTLSRRAMIRRSSCLMSCVGAGSSVSLNATMDQNVP